MSILNQLRRSNQGWNLAFRPSQVYSSVTGAYTLFSIDGAVSILHLVGFITAAAGGATTITVTVNTVAADNAGALVINGAVGTVVFVALNTAGANLQAAAIPRTIATGTPEFISGSQVAGPGLIVCTYGVSTATMTWSCLWRPLTPTARVY